MYTIFVTHNKNIGRITKLSGTQNRQTGSRNPKQEPVLMPASPQRYFINISGVDPTPSLADPRGRQGSASTLSVQFLSFSCSFQQKSCQTIGFHYKVRSLCPLQNPGSTTFPKLGAGGGLSLYFFLIF